jgi:1-acyl-sn-glycerol-3-phosphate acyltransferase
VPEAEPWYRFAEWTIRPLVALWFNWRFEGTEHILREGPLLVAANHISYLDPLAHGYMLVKTGRRPRFLAKKELYGNPVLRTVLGGSKHIPVDRGSGSSAPVEAALKALKAGEVVVIYPEGTITQTEDHSPMRGKTGVARLTLAANVPVLPMAVWGSQHVWQKRGARGITFGRPIWVKAGPPMDFSSFQGKQEDPDALREITDTVMAELTRLTQDLRARYPKRWR